MRANKYEKLPACWRKLLLVGLLLTLGATAPDEAQADEVVAQGYSIECVHEKKKKKTSSSGACFLPRYALSHYYPEKNSFPRVISFAEGGQRADRLRYKLETFPTYYRPYHQAAEVLVLDMGAGDYLSDVRPAVQRGCDDACVDAKIAAFEEDYDFIFDRMYSDKGAQTKFVPISMYQMLVEQDKALDSDGDGQNNFEEGRRFYQGVNAVIKEKAAGRGVEVVNLYEEFNGPTGVETTPFKLGYVSPDQVHPSVAGANRIARKVADLGYTPN